jgi:hypothetical protein
MTGPTTEAMPGSTTGAAAAGPARADDVLLGPGGQPPPTDPRRPVADLLLGARLALSAGRPGWARLLLSVTGIAAGVLVLLLAASVPNAYRAGQTRSDQLFPGSVQTGAAPVHVWSGTDQFRDHLISVVHISGTGPTAPVPPGLTRLPLPGEAVVSPALARLLAEPGSQLLRERYPQLRIGSIGKNGLGSPSDLRIYLGDPTGAGEPITSWGDSPYREPLPPLLWALLVVGVVVLLFPVFVLVTASTRLADAERDRRLGTLRLIGASSAQVRWVAAGESLLAAVFGLVAGGALFLLARPLLDGQSVYDVAVFGSDLVPAWPLVALIVVAVPVLAAGSALFALRRTLVEPLGVVRQASPPGRRLWWRLLPALGGAALLLYVINATRSGRAADRPVALLVTGVVLLLLGVPTVLPWLLQRALRPPRDETVALQLATRRLQQDSGTPARVVGGIGVVLAGAIGLSTLLAAAESRYSDGSPMPPGQVVVAVSPGPASPVARLSSALRQVPGVGAVNQWRSLYLDGGGELRTGDCAALRTQATLPSCVDGQVFVSAGSVAAGQPVRIPTDAGAGSAGVRWTVPAGAPTVPLTAGTYLPGVVLATPAALPAAVARLGNARIDVRFDPADPDTIERIRNVAAPLGPQVSLTGATDVTAGDDHSYRSIRRGLFAGALLTLLLAGATLLAATVDQVRQRRWPLAALAATGVPGSTLARSVLWQTAIPMLFAVLVADLTGLVLGLLLPRVVAETPVLIDWAGVVSYSAAAVAVVGVVTALTLPAVRQATRPTSLRSE